MSKFDKNYRRLPSHVRKKCDDVLQRIKSGDSMRALNAKFIERFKHCRQRLVSVPLNSGYRLVLIWSGLDFEPADVGPHREYEKYIGKI